MQINVFNSYKVRFLFLALLFIYTSCKQKHPPVSFYYWKQEFVLSKKQSKLLKDTKTNKIYVKFFDIVIDEVINEVRPNAIINFETKTSLDKINVYSQTGAFIKTIEINYQSNKVDVNLKNLQKGIYLIELQNKTEKTWKKVIIE